MDRCALVEHEKRRVVVDERLDRSDVNLPVLFRQQVIVANLGSHRSDHRLVRREQRLGEKDVLARVGEHGHGLWRT